MRRSLRQAVPLVLLLACSRTTVAGTEDLGAGDAGAPDQGALDSGRADMAMPLVCGGATCAPEAEACCPVPNCETGVDELICPIGAFNCPDVEECPPDECAPFDARGEGVCALGLGVAWTGTTCTFLSGCECAGSDCGELYVDLLDCFRDNAACERACGAEPSCGPASFCDFTRNGCGTGGHEGRCEPRPMDCELIFAPVCGCDGMTYDNACAAHLAGQDVLFDGEC